MKNLKQFLTSILLPLILSLTLVLGTGFYASAFGLSNIQAGEVGPGLKVISMVEDGVTYEVSVAWEDLSVEPVEVDGKSYVQVSLPGWLQTFTAGLPGLPVQVEELGVPFGAEVVVEVTPGTAHRVELSAPVLPAVTKVAEWGLPSEDETMPVMPETVNVYEEDAGVYGGGREYPGVLGEVSGDGIMRQQRVVGVSVYPVQYDAGAQELTVYETLTVTVRYEGGAADSGRGISTESEAYENLMEGELLNYEEARGYREAEVQWDVQVEGATAEAWTEDGLSAWAPPSPGWRVKVRADGLYKLSYEELSGVGVPVTSLDVNTLQMYHDGVEVALQVELGVDGVFNGGDYIVFYGESIDSKYTQDNVYWLTYGVTTGLRMEERDGAPASGAIPTDYTAHRHMSGGGYYLSSIPDIGDSEEHFLWGRVYPTKYPTWTTTFTQVVPNIGSATMTVSFLGGFASPSVNPDHHVVVTLNGTQIGDVKFDGISWHTAQLTIPAGVLKTSPQVNTLVFTGPIDLGLTYDLVYIDWIDLDYPNTFVAQNDGLAFTYGKSGTWKYQVSGFSTDQVLAYDVTDPAAPVRISGLSASGSGPYTAEFEDTVTEATNYWTGASTALATVQGIEADTPSSLRTTTKAADYIVITPSAFSAAAETLKNYRAVQGLRVMVVDVQDVYDEFSYGIVEASAIHDFLAYAYANWVSPAPTYVVLMGDGNYDPKNYLGFGRVSQIPPYLLNVDPWIDEAAADNRYVTVSGADTMPDMMLGRLSVNSAAEADAIVAKIIAYEQTPPSGTWQSQILSVTDNADSGGNYPLLADNLTTCCMPPSYSIEKIYFGITHTDKTAAQNAVKTGYGKLIVNYIGHGYSYGWAGESLFTTSTVPSLLNGAQQPIVLPMTCMEGYFINPDPYFYAVAEVTTRAVGKGAIASWSPTGQGIATGHDFLNRGFLNSLLTDGADSVGAATLAGKLKLSSMGVSPDLMDTYLLFGDPALRTRVSTTHIISDTPDPSAPGEPYTVAVEVKGSFDEPAGSVAVSDDEGNTCTAPLVDGAGSCELTSFTPGNTVLTASFAGDGFYTASVGTTNHLVSGLLSISGTVLDALSAPLAGVIVSDGQEQEVKTDQLGQYTLANLIAGSYTVTPYRLGYTFSPASRLATITNDNVTGVNFTATPVGALYSISGRITDDQGVPLPDVRVSNEFGQTVLTDSSGLYTLTGFPVGSYRIIPEDDVYIFDPEWILVDVIDTDITAVDFVGTVYIFPIGKPPLISPVHKTKTNDNDVTLVWKTVQDGAYYKLIIAKDALFQTKVLKQIIPAAGLERSLNITLTDFPDGTYYWRVKAYNASDVKLGSWSDAWKFKVDTVPPAIPVLYKPADNKLRADTTPTLSVLAASGAKFYQYQVSIDAGFTSIVAESDQDADPEWTVPVTLPYGEFYWRARAIDAAGNISDWSSSRRLIISFQKLPKYGAVTSVKRPTFEWVAVTGADNYRLIVDDDRSELYLYDVSGLIPVTTHTLPLANKLAVGTYYWKMEARVGGDWLETPWIPLTITP